MCWDEYVIRRVYFPMVKSFALTCQMRTGSNVQLDEMATERMYTYAHLY